MKIKINLAALGRSKWYEYLLRFAFGGAVTALTGVIAKRWGPEVGGLFLAFPAIFPAAATLLEKHEEQKKLRTGKTKILRAREIAGVDAAGAAMGSIGLIAFGAVVWGWVATDHPVAIVLGVATLGWLLTAVTVWAIHETIWRRLRMKLFSAPRHAGHPGLARQSSENRRSDE